MDRRSPPWANNVRAKDSLPSFYCSVRFKQVELQQTPKARFALRGTSITLASPNRLNRQWVKMAPFQQIQKAGE